MKFESATGILTPAIDHGLARSRFGVVIISPSFFEKTWTQMELNALVALEADAGAKRILPVWHNVSSSDVAAKSPLLAAVRAARDQGWHRGDCRGNRSRAARTRAD